MAEYSFSGNTYTDKSDGDIIQPEHVNDLQDEVEIVEGVLTGGTDGQVLTADAEGKAGWEDASGGGGAFAYDGVTFNLEVQPGSYYDRWFTLEIIATLAGVEVESPVMLTLWVATDAADYGNFGEMGTIQIEWDGDGYGPVRMYEQTSSTSYSLYKMLYDPSVDNSLLKVTNQSSAGDYKIIAELPDGSIVVSDTMTWEAVPSP